MPTLTDLAGQAGIRRPDLDWLHALISDWLLLADLSFADLVLWAPLRGDCADCEVGRPGDGDRPDRHRPGDDELTGERAASEGSDHASDSAGSSWPHGASWIALAQMRPTTAPTALPDDIVGTIRPGSEQPLLTAAYTQQRVCREGDPEWTRGVPVRHETIPVSRDGRVVAVIERSTNLSFARTPSRLDLAYLKAADDLTQMVAAGMFPAPGEEPVLVRSPRVGDGLLRLSRSGKVTYASPNALSAYRRLGLTADLVGKQLGPLTARLCAGRVPRDDSLMVAASGRAHAETEIDANGSVVQLRTIPLIVDGERAGALILLRDVTELRHRERELLTKDATIREIHHRVKNNLQTVAALLRLQSRRLRAPEARAALDEAVRRVGSIAMVHETLSRVPDEIVDFDEIAERVAMMAGEVSAPEVRVTPRLLGEFGLLPALVATPLALVLTELLQNAHQHGLNRPGQATAAGFLEISAVRSPGKLTVVVSDNGVGLPADFDLDSTSSLGLQIVRTLVLTELSGRLEIAPRPGGGTKVLVELPLELQLADAAPVAG
ncbi:MAG TPA: histidine kinase N-terminal domain-containing protein [Streptosporangiaceae bacterium]|nr:histidine kinase N-terminal domain-containing protein [Streptosporangiaceae bacterium]